MSMKIAINGFGRIGRTFFRQAFENDKVEIVAINDIGDWDNLRYLLAYDTVYGRWHHDNMSLEKGGERKYLRIGDTKILTTSEKDPAALPWQELDVDVVVESTGLFTQKEDAAGHLEAGAKRVVISANAEGEVEHVLPGSNDDKFDASTLSSKITSDGSCTTNSGVPVLSILDEAVGVEKVMLTTIHGYTSSQELVDAPSKKRTRGRAAAANIVPTTTSSREAIPKALPGIQGIFDAMAIRVPVTAGSISDVVFISGKETTSEEINNAFRQAAGTERWQRILKVTEEDLVSSDIVKEPYGAIVALNETRVVDGNLCKVMVWYDNEWGYSASLLQHVIQVGELV